MMENRMASYYEVGNSSKSKRKSYSNSNSSDPNTKSSFGFMMESSWKKNTMSMIESGTTNSKEEEEEKSVGVAPPIPIIMQTSAEDKDKDKGKACKTHKEAERRRRKRINAHLATLRTLVPNLIKTDKASVLAEVVRRVRELKKATVPTYCSGSDDGCKCNNNINACFFPGDSDEVRLQRSENDNNTLVATLCCEDRPELIVDLTRALRSVKAKVLRAEIATVGGRTMTVLSVCGVASGAPEGLLRRALKVVADKPSFASSGLAHGLRMSPPF